MTSFHSYAMEIEQLISEIIASDIQHGLWLNTLSYLENCGARKIAACEHPTLVKEEVLKHAAEEFRHAHYLKRQISKVTPHPMNTYSSELILGGMATWHYLQALDLRASRYLKEQGFQARDLIQAAYLCVTYAIERRAEELYPIYDRLLRKAKARVTVKSILLEEQEHLAEMNKGIAQIPSGNIHAEMICAIESRLCERWLQHIANYNLMPL